MFSGSRPDIHDTVGRTHGIFIMLHHKNGIAEIPQMQKRLQQLVIIPLVKSDTRLVQNIGNTDQAGTNLGSKTDTLRLAAGQSAGSPGQGQIIKAHINQERHPRLDLLQNRGANRLLHRRKLKLVQKFPVLNNRHIRRFVNILISDRNGQCFRLQTLAMAGRAGCNSHICLVLRLHGFGKCFPVLLVHVLYKAFKGYIVNALPPLALIADFYNLSAGSPNQDVMNLLWVFLKRCVEAEMVFLRQRFQNRSAEAALVAAGLPSHRDDGALFDAEALIRYHQVFVKFHLISQAIAVRTGSEGIIKRKASRLHLVHTDSAVRAGKALAEHNRFLAENIYHHQPAGQPHNRVYGVGKPLLDSLLHHQTVNHYLYIMFDIFLQLDGFRQLI